MPSFSLSSFQKFQPRLVIHDCIQVCTSQSCPSLLASFSPHLYNILDYFELTAKELLIIYRKEKECERYKIPKLCYPNSQICRHYTIEHAELQTISKIKIVFLLKAENHIYHDNKRSYSTWNHRVEVRATLNASKLSISIHISTSFLLSTLQNGRQPVLSPVCHTPFILKPTERIQLIDYLPTEIGHIQTWMYESGELGPRQLGDPPVYLVEGKREIVGQEPREDESVANNAIKMGEVCS